MNRTMPGVVIEPTTLLRSRPLPEFHVANDSTAVFKYLKIKIDQKLTLLQTLGQSGVHNVAKGITCQ